MMRVEHTLAYECPWAAERQPRVWRIKRGWFKRDKLEMRELVWLRIPAWVRARVPRCPEWVPVPKRFRCDGRSTPLGVMLKRDTMEGILHDWLYRLGEWYEWLELFSPAQREHWFGITSYAWKQIGKLLRLTRADADAIFRFHLQDRAAMLPAVRGLAHRAAALPQWATVRALGRQPWTVRERAPRLRE